MAKFVAKSVPAQRYAVIGGGWAGCACAMELVHAGHTVTLFEAARTLGGRARKVEREGTVLDNGQHILLGAYTETLRLLKLAGQDPRALILDLPLQMRYPPDSGGMDFIAPRWPAPLHLAWALLRAKGLQRADKLSLMRFSSAMRWMGWQLYNDCSVSELLERFDQTERLIKLMWRPLCLAALNTPPERASARVFINVLRDSLGASKRSASDMLLPKTDLSSLFPDAAARYVTQYGGAVQMGVKVDALTPLPDGRWQVDGADIYDVVVIATSSAQAATLLQGLQDERTSELITQLQAFTPEAISTCYLQYEASVRLDLPFYALADAPEAAHWGQFVFDRGQLDTSQQGLLAVVISASSQAAEQGHAALAQAIASQLAQVLGQPALAQPLWTQVITEKRATFACTPDLQRPSNASGIDGLLIAGDYTASDYPATIEAAVRSGVQAAAQLNQQK
ncbi:MULTISPECIES: hydroxysqualene dehydroxylase HpnE [unclassified Janthinobacterium]|uniref:hydroxysqualene dehydroxylase HpnE n=1 Tax=unclassified Janthinobacterium TaxID=2610881 RepID=UPI0017B9F5AD|nr:MULTISPECIES: hydroxysqualene dehydroxylase HpnE [unclassified Janthinobacterium]MBB5369898.1 squalene-associated FAD-dependent desaturase [Janthinobacterium sp. K2C7]MBB5382704.1 squalene-associated FAD-dependent desaturase [Janthinobacterium sp. K2Li3]MBB5384689.1 squalene-associated FAD-dependent desaturase [Janthinobacterium sp. K2E3]